jgi:hypothetical protein
LSLARRTTKTKSPSRSTPSEVTFHKAGGTGKRSFAFYGPSGTGKTTISGTFPKPIIIVDAKDRGTDSISEYSEEDVKVFAVEEWEDLEDLYAYLRENPKACKTLVIDTITQLQQVCIEKVLRDKKKDSSKAGDWGTMTKREWGDVSTLMKQWIILLRDLPKLQVVFLAQQRVFNVDEDADDSDNSLAPEVGPRLSPSVAAHLNAAVDVIGSTFVRRKQTVKEVNGKKIRKERAEYCLRVGPNPVYITKIRKPKAIEAPALITNPDYDSIMAIINGDE